MPFKRQSVDNPVSKGRPQLVGYINVFLDFFKGKTAQAIVFTQICYRKRRNEILKLEKPIYSKPQKISDMTGIPKNTVTVSMGALRKMGLLEQGLGKKIIFTEKGEKLYSLFLMATNKVKAYTRKK